VPRALAFTVSGDNNTVVVWSSDDHICISQDITELLEFLRFAGKDVIRVAFEIDEFAAPFLRKLPLQNLVEIRDTKETVFGGFRIYYIPRVVFQIGGAGERFGTRYYGIKNFLNIPGILPTPQLAAVQETADSILAAIADVGLGGDRLQLMTPGAVFLASDRGSRFMASIPLGHHLPGAVLDDTISLSALADDKYWVGAYQLGRWMEGEIWDYDLTAAFASMAAGLVDIRDLSFWKSDHISKREQAAYYGVIPGSFYIYPDVEYSYASPIIAMLDNGLQGNPVGILPEDVYTLDEIRTVEGLGIGEFTQGGVGVFATPISGVRPRFPYRDMMCWLYDQRAISEMAGTVCKVAANAIIGKMIEKREDAAYRNRFYHAQITASTRCQIARFLCANGIKNDELVAVQTDGVKLTRDISLSGSGMGSWRNNGSQPTIIHSGHKVYVGDKRPYKISYSDVAQLVSDHPNIERYSKNGIRRITLMEAVEQENVSRVGELVDMPTYFDLIVLDMQQTRLFDVLPATGSELLENKYSSRPFDAQR
jgi:hypothetical protein